MGPINKIMAAVDFSDYSKATLKYAALLASSVNATLVVANVINQRDVEAIRKVEVEGRRDYGGKIYRQAEAGPGNRDRSTVEREQLSGSESCPGFSRRGSLGGTAGNRQGSGSGFGGYGDQGPNQYRQYPLWVHGGKDLSPLPGAHPLRQREGARNDRLFPDVLALKIALNDH